MLCWSGSYCVCPAPKQENKPRKNKTKNWGNNLFLSWELESQVVSCALGMAQLFQNRTEQRVPGGKAPGENGINRILDVFEHVENNKI